MQKAIDVCLAVAQQAPRGIGRLNDAAPDLFALPLLNVLSFRQSSSAGIDDDFAVAAPGALVAPVNESLMPQLQHQQGPEGHRVIASTALMLIQQHVSVSRRDDASLPEA